MLKFCRGSCGSRRESCFTWYYSVLVRQSYGGEGGKFQKIRKSNSRRFVVSDRSRFYVGPTPGTRVLCSQNAKRYHVFIRKVPRYHGYPMQLSKLRELCRVPPSVMPVKKRETRESGKELDLTVRYRRRTIKASPNLPPALYIAFLPPALYHCWDFSTRSMRGFRKRWSHHHHGFYYNGLFSR